MSTSPTTGGSNAEHTGMNDDSSQRVLFHPIGTIRTPFNEAARTPIQPIFGRGVGGRVEMLPQYADGLAGLDGFSHIYLLFLLHRSGTAKLRVKPFLHDNEQGVFSTRAPARPNPIGLSLVRLIRRKGCILEIEDVDMLDGTPLLDIKPYTPRFDARPDAREGWLEGVDTATAERLGRRHISAEEQ